MNLGESKIIELNVPPGLPWPEWGEEVFHYYDLLAAHLFAMSALKNPSRTDRIDQAAVTTLRAGGRLYRIGVGPTQPEPTF